MDCEEEKSRVEDKEKKIIWKILRTTGWPRSARGKKWGGKNKKKNHIDFISNRKITGNYVTIWALYIVWK